MGTNGFGELRIDTVAVARAGQGLLDAANQIPAPPEPLAAATGDPLSEVGLAHQQAAEDSLIEGMPMTKQDAVGSAEKIMRAAQTYETTDKLLADSIFKRTIDAPGHPTPRVIWDSSAFRGFG